MQQRRSNRFRRWVLWTIASAIMVVLCALVYKYLSIDRPHPFAFNTREVLLDDGSLLRVFVRPSGSQRRDMVYVVHVQLSGQSVTLLEGWAYGDGQHLFISDDGKIEVDYMPLAGGDVTVVLDVRAALSQSP